MPPPACQVKLELMMTGFDELFIQSKVPPDGRMVKSRSFTVLSPKVSCPVPASTVIFLKPTEMHVKFGQVSVTGLV